MRKKEQTTPVYLLKTDASTFTHNRPITHIYCIFSWTFARSCEFCSLNTGRSVSCKLTVYTGGSSAGQCRLDFPTPSSSFNMGIKLLSVLYCNHCVNTSALTHAVVYCWWQCIKLRAVSGPVGGQTLSGRRTTNKLPSTPEDAHLHLKNTRAKKRATHTHTHTLCQGCQVGNKVLYQRLRTIIVWGKWSPSVFIL